MYNLGQCYENGRGVAQDYRDWYQKAADKGYAVTKTQIEQLPSR